MCCGEKYYFFSTLAGGGSVFWNRNFKFDSPRKNFRRLWKILTLLLFLFLENMFAAISFIIFVFQPGNSSCFVVRGNLIFHCTFISHGTFDVYGVLSLRMSSLVFEMLSRLRNIISNNRSLRLFYFLKCFRLSFPSSQPGLKCNRNPSNGPLLS